MIKNCNLTKLIIINSVISELKIFNKKLTSINLNQSISLKCIELNCNNLKEVILTKCYQLVSLTLQSDRILELNLSMLRSLKVLNIFSATLKNLIFKGCCNINYFGVNCDDSHITKACLDSFVKIDCPALNCVQDKNGEYLSAERIIKLTSLSKHINQQSMITRNYTKRTSSL